MKSPILWSKSNGRPLITCRKSCYCLILRLRRQSLIVRSRSKLVHVYSPLHDECNTAGSRRGSIPVSTVLRKSVRFFIINIFLIKNFKISKLISGKWFGQPVNIPSEWLRNPGKGTLLPGEHAPDISRSRKLVSIYSRSAPGPARYFLNLTLSCPPIALL